MKLRKKQTQDTKQQKQKKSEAKKQRRAAAENNRAQNGSAYGLNVPGGGAARMFQSPREWRGSTRQVCGLWPFAAGGYDTVFGCPVRD